MSDLGIEEKKSDDNQKTLQKAHYFPFPRAHLKPNTFPLSLPTPAKSVGSEG